MPYQHQTKRSLRRHFISFDDVQRANWQVTAELERLGLWHTVLDPVDVYYVPASWCCYGWYMEEGDIYISAVSGARLAELVSGHHTRVTDVLRHEWAHALADRRPSLVRTRDFREAYGGSYQASGRVSVYDPQCHLTKYASTSPCEDFAETFLYYLRHKGRLPKWLKRKPIIANKWRYIAEMAKRLRLYHTTNPSHP